MVAFAGGAAQWRALPFPIRIAAGLFGVIIVIWLARWLGSASVLLAVAIWAAVLVGVLHASGRLAWTDRHPTIGRALAVYAPHIGTLPIATTGSRVERAATSESTVSRPVIPDISRFVGIDEVKLEIDSLVESRSALKSTVAPATIVFLVGPRGAGKSSVALAMASVLHKAAVVRSERIVAISDVEVPGLSDSYGPNADVLKSLSDRIQSALDGVLLIDDLDRLISFSGGQVALETGTRLLNVARRYPGRLFVICTGSKEAFAKLDPGKRWLGQLNVRKIEFFALTDDALRQIFLDLLSSQGFQLASEAERALGVRVKEIKQDGGEEFDNAHAIRRFVDSVLHNYGLRVRQRSNVGAAVQRTVVADEVRNAVSSV